MLHVALYEPEIPPNTGNILRLCANTGSQLLLIKPLGFCLDDKQLRRAGLDYQEYAEVQLHDSYADLVTALDAPRIWGLSTHGATGYGNARFADGDVLLFGPETRGLPENVRQELGDRCLRIPMMENSRSINLSNATAVVLYEALRQLGFPRLS